ncbi:MAG: hypothetical protein WB706_03080, partial [Nitrososphaeraceae archaeon]
HTRVTRWPLSSKTVSYKEATSGSSSIINKCNAKNKIISYGHSVKVNIIIVIDLPNLATISIKFGNISFKGITRFTFV